MKDDDVLDLNINENGNEEDNDNNDILELNLDQQEIEQMNIPSFIARELFGNSGGLKQDERSSTPGPCRCGYRHWVDGIEHDFVIRLDSDKGTLPLGFNKNDNAYIVAQNFVARHNLNKGSLNDKAIVNKIANCIMEAEREMLGDEEMVSKENQSNFNPYQSNLIIPNSGTVYNKTTGKFEKFTHYNIDQLEKKKKDDEERKKEAEVNQLNVMLEKEKTEKERNEIKNKIKLDQQEIRNRKSETRSSPVISSHKKKPVVGEDGRLTWVDDDKPSYYEPEEGKYSSLGNIKKKKHDHSEQQRTNRIHIEGDEEDNDIPDPNPEMDIPEIIPLVVRKIIQQQGSQTKAVEWLLGKDFTLHKAVALCQVAEHVISSGNQGKEVILVGGSKKSEGEVSPRDSPRRVGSPYLRGEGRRLDEEFSSLKIEEVEEPEKKEDVEVKYETISVDTNLPQSKIRVRLMNGGQQTIIVNLSNTVAQLKEHIASISNVHIDKFKLLTQYPRNVITNLDVTIEVAKLGNESIIQEKV